MFLPEKTDLRFAGKAKAAAQGKRAAADLF